MLHVWMASGEELATIPSDELSDALSLKYWLRAQRRMPVCLLQLLHDGSRLADEAELKSITDVQLVLSVQSESYFHKDLLDAAGAGDIVAVGWLLKAASPQAIMNQDGDTALHAASCNGHTEVVHLLLKAGAAKDAEDSMGRTALHFAAMNGNAVIVRLLLEADAGKDTTDLYNQTALHLASCGNHVEVVRLLLEAGAATEITRVGKTALHLAAAQGHVEVVSWLFLTGYWLGIFGLELELLGGGSEVSPGFVAAAGWCVQPRTSARWQDGTAPGV